MNFVFAILVAVVLTGCASPAKKAGEVRLGMAPDEVADVMGKPTTIRASKVFEDGRTMQVWEYVQTWAFNPRDVWIFFEDDKVVQWGAPGDFFGKAGQSQKIAVQEYKAVKQGR